MYGMIVTTTTMMMMTMIMMMMMMTMVMIMIDDDFSRSLYFTAGHVILNRILLEILNKNWRGSRPGKGYWQSPQHLSSIYLYTCTVTICFLQK